MICPPLHSTVSSVAGTSWKMGKEQPKYEKGIFRQRKREERERNDEREMRRERGRERILRQRVK
jgi:hypothetical protein